MRLAVGNRLDIGFQLARVLISPFRFLLQRVQDYFVQGVTLTGLKEG